MCPLGEFEMNERMNITLPRWLLNKIDTLCHKRTLCRSAFVRMAIRHYIEFLENTEEKP